MYTHLIRAARAARHSYLAAAPGARTVATVLQPHLTVGLLGDLRVFSYLKPVTCFAQMNGPNLKMDLRTTRY